MDPKDEMGQLVAYVFQTVGRRRLSEDDWVRLLSLERQWAAPSRARRLAVLARRLGLLRNAGERDFELGLEAEGLVLPLDYRPDLDAIEAGLGTPGATDASTPSAVPLFRRIVETIAQALHQSESEVVARINASQAALGGLLRAEVVALYDGAMHGVDVSPFYEAVEVALVPLAVAS